MKITPKIIVDEGYSYSIPIYQRLFEWNTENIDTLLSDLWHCYESSKGERDYYIGMLTSTKKHELVDGQQRFVVLMLIGCVLKNYDGWKDFIGSADNPRLKFTSRPHDNKYLVALISDIQNEDKECINMKMKNGIERIMLFMDCLIKEQQKNFANYIYEHLSFFISTLPDDYSPKDLNAYFERMNTTGKNLEQHEILKVKLLRHLDNSSSYMLLWNKLADTDTLLIREDENKENKNNAIKIDIQSVIEGGLIIGNSEEETSSTIEQINPSSEHPSANSSSMHDSYSVLSFPHLLLQTLYLYRGTKDKDVKKEEFFKVSNLLDTFAKYLPYEDDNVNTEDIKSFMQCLLKYRLILDICFVRLTDVGYSLDMNMSEDNEKLKNLMMYESMLYVSSSNTTNYKWFGWIMDFVTSLGHIPTAEELYNHLKDCDEREHSIPESNLLSYGHVERYWFWKLDYYLWEKRKELFTKEETRAVADNYVFRRNRSIEHIAPQTPERDSAIQWEDTDNDRAIRDSFGNLAMISSGLNSALSNSSYEEKRAHVEAYCHKSKLGSIESLKLLWVYDKYDKWDKENIGKHMKEAISILKGESLEEERDDSAR